MRANPSMKERAPWPPRRSRAEERWRPRALMYDFEVTTVQVWAEGAGAVTRPGPERAATLAAKFQGFETL